MINAMHGGAMTEQEKILWERLAAIHNRVKWMADEEERSAWVNGAAAQGTLMPEKMKLLDETESILAKIEAMKNTK